MVNKLPHLARNELRALKEFKKLLKKELRGEEQIKEEAKKVIEELGIVGPQDIGKVMGALMPKLKGKAEGGMVSKAVNELLRGE